MGHGRLDSIILSSNLFPGIDFPAITRPKIPALILTLFLFRHMHIGISILFRQQILLYVFTMYFEKKICLCVCLSVYLSVYLYICLSVYLSVSLLFSGD